VERFVVSTIGCSDKVIRIHSRSPEPSRRPGSIVRCAMASYSCGYCDKRGLFPAVEKAFHIFCLCKKTYRLRAMVDVFVVVFRGGRAYAQHATRSPTFHITIVLFRVQLDHIEQCGCRISLKLEIVVELIRDQTASGA